MPSDTLILILAQDRGPGLDALTRQRTKAAVPFGGKYRVIDFTLANCLHSGLRQVLVLTQYKSHSLQKHLRDGWSIFNPELGEFITPVPPQMRECQDWYLGPFDAIRQNRYLIERNRASQVLVLQGGAIYRMDYAELARAHRETGAAITVATRAVPEPGSGRQARAVLDAGERILELHAPEPADVDGEGSEQQETMGVYLFDKALLLDALARYERGISPDTDLALDVIAPLTASQPVHAYRFGQTRGRVTPDRYWCDLTSIDAYYQANMALLRAEPPLDLYQPDWTILTYQGQHPPARTVPGPHSGTEGVFVNSMLAAGTVISGGGVNHSILFPQVRVEDGAIVEASILFQGVKVGAGAHLRQCIVEKDVVVAPGDQIGFDARRDRERFAVSPEGIVVVSGEDGQTRGLA
ncbi:glucose-1-phosphate adenylyltransferase family protein [Allochromatium palmeri]|uniref:Glucose-1-phosphate adenylyltransferase n=1 Tax=Allochromatium palmeri TaxID=231048 RepID=A0A6N8EG93_9GAMM|nr:sugar phosphate nucleotidyltransferase [Allochromatium palmeri]MTW22078.1 glucose-1-phosphate adenylyltransferase [Allochromatium palmeri]